MSTAEIDVYKEWLGIPEGDRPPDHYQLLRLVQFFNVGGVESCTDTEDGFCPIAR